MAETVVAPVSIQFPSSHFRLRAPEALHQVTQCQNNVDSPRGAARVFSPRRLTSRRRRGRGRSRGGINHNKTSLLLSCS